MPTKSTLSWWRDCEVIRMHTLSMRRRGTGIEENVMSTSRRGARRARATKSTISAASCGGAVPAAVVASGARSEMKSVHTVRGGQSEGRAKVPGRIGMTSGTSCCSRVGQVSTGWSPNSRRSVGSAKLE